MWCFCWLWEWESSSWWLSFQPGYMLEPLCRHRSYVFEDRHEFLPVFFSPASPGVHFQVVELRGFNLVLKEFFFEECLVQSISRELMVVPERWKHIRSRCSRDTVREPEIRRNRKQQSSKWDSGHQQCSMPRGGQSWGEVNVARTSEGSLDGTLAAKVAELFPRC